MRGESVRELQDILNILGFLDEGSDGVFGDRTRQAVIAFQKANGLTVDGIVGADTWSLLEAEMARPRLETYIVNQGDTLYDLARLLGVSVDELAAINNISNPALIRVGQELLIPVTGIASRGKPGAAEMLHWDTANRIFKVGSIVTVIDVRTGLTFRVRRRGGSLHADVEPYTKEDLSLIHIFGLLYDIKGTVVHIGTEKITLRQYGLQEVISINTGPQTKYIQGESIVSPSQSFSGKEVRIILNRDGNCALVVIK